MAKTKVIKKMDDIVRLEVVMNTDRDCLNEYSDEITRNFRYLCPSRSGDAVSFVPQLGKRYYVLYVEYDTGDSFGFQVNGGFVVIDIYEDEMMAERGREAILLHDDVFRADNKNIEPLYVAMNNWEQAKIYCDWHECHTNLQTCEVVELKYRNR